jgi:hypothetical protein
MLSEYNYFINSDGLNAHILLEKDSNLVEFSLKYFVAKLKLAGLLLLLTLAFIIKMLIRKIGPDPQNNI